jgi:hypothetical protein
MARNIIFLLVFLLLSPGLAISQVSERVQAIRVFLDSGNPKQAIRTSEILLANSDIQSSERMSLLSLIAEAEVMRAKSRLFDNVAPSVQAIEALLKEFPHSPDAARFRWLRAWLEWKGGSLKKAIANAREVIALDQKKERLRQAWLLMARIHIKQEKYAFARSELLQYGMQADEGSQAQGIGAAWNALVDIGEARHSAAFKSLDHVYHRWPTAISAEPQLFAAYILLLHQYGRDKEALGLAESFTRQFITKKQAPAIRLLRADILAKQKNTIAAAINEYDILADRQAETAVGRKAFMRKLMLQNRDVNEREKLLPVIAAIRKVADRNQLSPLEDEAMLALARLWGRVEDGASRIASAISGENLKSPALHAYAQAATSPEQAISRSAGQEGAARLEKIVSGLLAAGQWMKAVVIWRQFPQLHPPEAQSQTLRFGIARAMRKLLLFDAAEALLDKLYIENKASISGQRAMLELIKLWQERSDSNAVEKIMRWLNTHEFTLFRPEILIVVARIQLAQGHAEAARQTLKSVQSATIALEARADYWKVRAETAEAMSQWHVAAQAWSHYRGSASADSDQGLINQANNLFTAKEYAAALKLYRQMPKQKHDRPWQYYSGVSLLRTGQLTQGTERLQALAGEKDAGAYGALAKLALADQLAGELLGELP